MESQPHLTYITTSSFPARKASSVQVMQMCAAFAEAGALVKLVARQTEASNDVFDYYGVPATFRFAPRPFQTLPRPTDIFQIQAALAEPDRNWICYARGQDMTAPIVALLRGAWAIVEAHGPPVTFRQRMMLNWIARHPCGRLIVISEPLRQYYQTLYRVTPYLAPDAVDLQRFQPWLSSAEARTRLGLASGPWVVYVGGLYAGRGLETLFRAVSDLPVNLLVVGGRDEADLAVWRDRAIVCGEPRVRFEGYQSPARVPLYLFAADILAMPYGRQILTGSGEDITQWTSPLKLYEYLASGRPIVSTDVQAVRGVLQHEHNALLAQPDDADSLRTALARLLAEPTLADKLAKNALQTVQSHTWVARAKSILELVSFG